MVPDISAADQSGVILSELRSFLGFSIWNLLVRFASFCVFLSTTKHHAGSSDSLEPEHLVSGGLSCGCLALVDGSVGPPEWLHRNTFDLTLTVDFGMCFSSLSLFPSPPPPHCSTSRSCACIIGFSGSLRVTRECGNRTDERSPPWFFSITTKRMMGSFLQPTLRMTSLENAGAGT